MSTFDGNNFYFSGQGVVLVGDRDTNGKPKGLIPVGNVSALTLGLAATALEHKESQTGNRAIDLRLITELKSTLQMTIENFSSDGLASALTGTVSQLAAASIVDEPVTGYANKVTGLANINIDTFVLSRGAQVLTAYVNDATPYDYKVNLAAGSFMINNGAVTVTDEITTGGTAPSAVVVGATTSITVANTAAVGSYVIVDGFTGADAALLNGKAHRIVTASPTVITVATNTLGKTITLGVPVTFFDGGALLADYNASAQNRVDAMTSLSTEKYMRFEGLNTADGGNPVIVEVYRFIVDPLKELALIGEGIGPFVLDGNVLADSLQTSGSKFFKVTQLR